MFARDAVQSAVMDRKPLLLLLLLLLTDMLIVATRAAVKSIRSRAAKIKNSKSKSKNKSKSKSKNKGKKNDQDEAKRAKPVCRTLTISGGHKASSAAAGDAADRLSVTCDV